MKTLYSSSFISVVMAFLMFMGHSGQPIERVQTGRVIRFSNVIESSAEPAGDKIQVEWFDNLTCPSCTEQTLSELMRLKSLEQEAGDFELRLYFVPDLNDERYSQVALGLKCAAEQEKYWNMHQRVHENKAELSLEKLSEMAAGLEMDTEVFEACMEDQRHQSEIEADLRYASEKNIHQWPTIQINQYQLIGPQPFENIERILNRARREKAAISTFDIDNLPTDLELELNPSEQN